MQEQDEPRNEAGQDGDVDPVDLAAEVQEMKRQLVRSNVRQRALIRAIANTATLQLSEMERLLAELAS